jgi:hypothetical protein
MLESAPVSARHARRNHAIVGIKLGGWLVENRREAEAVPILERGIQACRGMSLDMGLSGVQWDAEMALLEALYALKQRDRLLGTLKTVVRWYEKRLAEGTCSERDLAEVKSALGGSIGHAMMKGKDPDPGVMVHFLKLGEEALEGESRRECWDDVERPVVGGALMGAYCSCGRSSRPLSG